MSDGPGGFFLPFPIQPDPDTLERIRAAQDHEQMIVEDYHHGTARLFESLSEEQLVAQKTMLHVIAANCEDRDRAIPAYYEGIITGILAVKHNVCIGCHRNHDKVMADQMDREAEEAASPPPMDGGNPHAPAPLKADLKIGEVGFLSDVQLANMEEYNLDDLRSSDDNRLMGFVCLGCGLHYTSIEDRMLRPADKGGCSGCVQKEQWG